MTGVPRSNLLRSAERQIRASTGERVRLVEPESLPSPHVLFRCRVEGVPGRSVIIKQVTTSQFTSGEEDGTSHRLLNEWATLEFLASLPEKGPWPDLVAANRDESFVVLGDLGRHPNVEEILLSGSLIQGADALRHLGESLGRFHAAAHGRTSRFIAIRAGLDGFAPRSDSTYDLREARDLFEESFEALGIEPSSAFWGELADLESSLHGPGPFVTLIHADAGPQNFVRTPQDTVLIDFEFATVGNALLDLVSARLGFPHSSDAHTVPPHLVERLENAYRPMLSDAIPEVEDDQVFQQCIVDACAHWALVRWGGLWRRLLAASESSDDGRIETMRSQAFTLYRRFVETAEGTGHRESITATVDRMTKAIEKRLPGLAEMPVYLALTG